jgi:hypothetical protein
MRRSARSRNATLSKGLSLAALLRDGTALVRPGFVVDLADTGRGELPQTCKQEFAVRQVVNVPAPQRGVLPEIEQLPHAEALHVPVAQTDVEPPIVPLADRLRPLLDPERKRGHP